MDWEVDDWKYTLAEIKKQKIIFTDESPQRLDKFLASTFLGHSRSKLQRLITEEYVLVNGKPPKKLGQLLKKGDCIEVAFPPDEPVNIIPEEIPLDIIFEDENVLVINKPAGMVVHPSAGHSSGTIVHAVLAHLGRFEGYDGNQRAGIVHRLDKDTSGIIMIAKNEESLKWLQHQFKIRETEKIYIALVDGKPATSRGRIIAPLYRHPRNRKRMAIAPEGKGKNAETEYEVLHTFQRHTLLRVHPLTGRTHQIRVHLSSIDNPVVGDRVYGLRNPSLPMNRFFLHAAEIEIRLPGKKNKTKFEAQLPADLSQILEKLIAEE